MPGRVTPSNTVAILRQYAAIGSHQHGTKRLVARFKRLPGQLHTTPQVRHIAFLNHGDLRLSVDSPRPVTLLLFSHPRKNLGHRVRQHLIKRFVLQAQRRPSCRISALVLPGNLVVRHAVWQLLVLANHVDHILAHESFPVWLQSGHNALWRQHSVLPPGSTGQYASNRTEQKQCFLNRRKSWFAPDVGFVPDSGPTENKADIKLNKNSILCLLTHSTSRFDAAGPTLIG